MEIQMILIFLRMVKKIHSMLTLIVNGKWSNI